MVEKQRTLTEGPENAKVQVILVHAFVIGNFFSLRFSAQDVAFDAQFRTRQSRGAPCAFVQ